MVPHREKNNMARTNHNPPSIRIKNVDRSKTANYFPYKRYTLNFIKSSLTNLYNNMQNNHNFIKKLSITNLNYETADQ